VTVSSFNCPLLQRARNGSCVFNTADGAPCTNVYIACGLRPPGNLADVACAIAVTLRKLRHETTSNHIEAGNA